MDTSSSQQSKNIIARYPLISFYVLAYAISWLIWSPVLFTDVSGDNASGILTLCFFAGAFGPFLAAIIVTGLSEGKSQVRALLKKLVLWRIGWPWYLVAILLLPLLTMLIAAAYFALPGKLPWSSYLSGTLSFTLIYPVALVATLLIGGPLGEELGWRGYAVPHLQKHTNALTAGIVQGVLWACWHLPVMGILAAGIPLGQYFPLYIVEAVALSVLMTWLLNNSRGSVLLAMLLHSAFNVSNSLFSRLGAGVDDGLWIILCLAGVYWALVLVVVLVYGPAHLTRKPDFDPDQIVNPQ